MKMQERMDVVEDCVKKVDGKIENIRDGIMSEMNNAFQKVNKNMKNLEAKQKDEWPQLAERKTELIFNRAAGCSESYIRSQAHGRGRE